MRGACLVEKVDWFDVGERAYAVCACNGNALPPLNYIEAQRWWLGGFGLGRIWPQRKASGNRVLFERSDPGFFDVSGGECATGL